MFSLKRNEPKKIDEPFLRTGHRGKLVKIVQQALSAGEYYIYGRELTLDGYYGPQTEAAVRQFQGDTEFRKTGELTFDEFEVLIGSMELALVHPQETQSSSDESLTMSVPSPFDFSEWGLNPNHRSKNRKVSFYIALVLLSAIAVVLIMKSDYTAKLSIRDLLEVFLSPQCE